MSAERARCFVAIVCGAALCTAASPVAHARMQAGRAVAPAAKPGSATDATSATPPVSGAPSPEVAPTEPGATEPTAPSTDATTGDATRSDATTDDAKPGDATTSDAKPGDATAEAPPADAKPTDAKPTDAKPTDAKATPKPDAKAAAAAAGDSDSAVPEKLSRMQIAGWWTIFGGVALGTVGGVLSGLSEREEDRALRLSVQYDLETGAQSQFEDVKGDYEDALKKGQRQANAAIAFGVLGLAACVAGVALLATDAVKRRRQAGARAKVRAHGPGLQVRF